MVRSPTALEKNTRAEGPSLVPGVPDEEEWLAVGEDEMVDRIVHAPVKLRGLRAFAVDDHVPLKELIQRTEAVVRVTHRAAAESGGLEAEERERLERAVSEYATELGRLSTVR